MIARNSTFAYKGQRRRRAAGRAAISASATCWKEACARAGNRLRITAQLIDADSGRASLGATVSTARVEDIFDVQDRITESVALVIEPHIRQAEIERSRRKRPENIDAYDLYLRTLSKIYTTRPDDNAEVYAQMTRAIALEPDYAPFLTNAIWALEFRIIMGWPPLTDDDRSACLLLVNRALANAHGDPTVLAECGSALVSIGRDYERGLLILSNAIEANPNHQFALCCAAIAKLHCGDIHELIELCRRAILMDPIGAMAHWPITAVAHAQMALGKYEESKKTAERSLAVNPNFPATYWMLIAANALLGQMPEAHRYLSEFRRIAPGVTIASMKAAQPDRYPDRMAAILEGLRLAGLEEG